MPKMIKNETPQLEVAYLTILELGGAYAHTFATLLGCIKLPTLVITDLDSVDPNKNNSACRADTTDAVTSNVSISSLLLNMKKNQTAEEKAECNEKRKVSSLMQLTEKDKTCSSANYQYVTFQQEIPVLDYGTDVKMIPRTFEEAFIYENIEMIRKGRINAFVTLEKSPDFEVDYQNVYEKVKAKGYKKVEFALKQIDTDEDWVTPAYIVEGLNWLCDTLELNPVAVSESSS
jgi:predicted ATP-dependent endonuclease of OLD family